MAEERVWALLAGGEGSEITEVSCESLNGPMFAAVGPHTDPDYPRYFTLFVLDGPGDTRLRAWNHAEAGDVLDDEGEEACVVPDYEAPLQPGTLLTFDSHSVHDAWLPDPRQRDTLKALTKASKGQWGKSMEQAIRATGLLDLDQAKGLMTLCVAIENATRPTPEQAEAKLLAAIRSRAPEAYRRAEAALARPARRPRP